MKILRGHSFPGRIRGRSRAWHWATVLALAPMLLFPAVNARAADTQPDRFLLVFETSSVMKKCLPLVNGMLAHEFSSNLQNEIRANDDLAVWTVDETLHTSAFPLTRWAPEEASQYAEQLDDFLKHAKYSRHASLEGLQPLLNQVVRSSERLTVLIFCDGRTPLTGTPYDAGVNEIMTNAVAQARGSPTAEPFILVLRSYHGAYLGCSVNRSSVLNFPKYPPPPTPPPAPPAAPAVPAVAVPSPLAVPNTGPAVTPVPALIIVGTNVTTNVAVLLKPNPAPPPPTPSEATNVSPAAIPPAAPESAAASTGATNAGTASGSAPNAVQPVVPPPPARPPIAATAGTTPAEGSNPPVAAPSSRPGPPPVKILPPPEPAVTAPPPSTSGPPATAPAMTPASAAGVTSNMVAAAPEAGSAETGKLWPWLVGGGLFAAAAGLGVWLLVRARRPQASLITRSLQNDPRPPPRK
jgi:hypothetical protein